MGNIYNDLIEAIKGFFTDGVSIDNHVFKMHRSFTVLLCLVFSFILALEQVSNMSMILSQVTEYIVLSFPPCKTCCIITFSFFQYAGKAIECTGKNSGDQVDTNIVNTFCWIHGTYTRYFDLEEANDTVRDPLKGRDSWYHLYGSCDPESTDCWHHIYYQFVPIVLILQAGAFYFPG